MSEGFENNFGLFVFSKLSVYSTCYQTKLSGNQAAAFQILTGFAVIGK